MDAISLSPTTGKMQAKSQVPCLTYPKFSRSSGSSQVEPSPATSISQERNRLWSGRTFGRYVDASSDPCRPDGRQQVFPEFFKPFLVRHVSDVTYVAQIKRNILVVLYD